MDKNCFVKGVMVGKMLKTRSVGTPTSAVSVTPSSVAGYDKASFLAGLAVGMSTRGALRWPARVDALSGYTCHILANAGMIVADAYFAHQADESYVAPQTYGAEALAAYCGRHGIESMEAYIAANLSTKLYSTLYEQSFYAADLRQSSGNAFPADIHLETTTNNLTLTNGKITTKAGENSDVTWTVQYTGTASESLVTGKNYLYTGGVNIGVLPKGDYRLTITSTVTSSDGSSLPAEWSFDHVITHGALSEKNQNFAFADSKQTQGGAKQSIFDFSTQNYDSSLTGSNLDFYAYVIPLLLNVKTQVTYSVHTVFDLKCISLSDESTHGNCTTLYTLFKAVQAQQSAKTPNYRIVWYGSWVDTAKTVDGYKHFFIPQNEIWPLVPFDETAGIFSGGNLETTTVSSGPAVIAEGVSTKSYFDLKLLTFEPYPFYGTHDKPIKSIRIRYNLGGNLNFSLNRTSAFSGLFNNYLSIIDQFQYIKIMGIERNEV